MVGSRFGAAGSYPSFPVHPRPGGSRPGQNRNNSILRLGVRSGHSRHRTANRKEPALPVRLPTRRSPAPSRSRLRTRADIEARRKTLGDDTAKEIDAAYAGYRAEIDPHEAAAVGAVYARSSSEFQHSVADQVRSVLDAALAHKVFVPRDLIFFDLAVSGRKERRPGLDALRAALADRKATVLLAFTTNRLFRKGYKCMRFVEEEVVERGLRAVFVKSGIDTAADGRWRLPLQVNALVDELTGSMYADNIRAAHEGLFARKCVVYTVPFGYAGKEVPGPLTKRGRPRRELPVDDETAGWVRNVFAWFVDDGRNITKIVEAMNDASAPPSPMSSMGQWTQASVRYLLTNPIYRGEWAYGRGQNVWQSQKDYVKRVLREEPLKVLRFDDLRVVPDELWHRAQARLAAMPQALTAGRKPKAEGAAPRPRLLNGLLVCGAHDRSLRVGGRAQDYMYCSKLGWCRFADIPCGSMASLTHPADRRGWPP